MHIETTIKALRDRWGKEKAQRDFARDLLCIYDGDWTHLILEALKERFLPETVKSLKVEIDPTLNLVQRVVDEVAAVYTEPATRLVDDLEPEQYTRDGLIDDVFDVADKMLLLCRNLLLRPYVIDDGIDWDIITPDRFTVLPRKGRRGQVEAVMYEVPQEKRWVVWTPDEHVVLTKDWQLDTAFGIQPNEYETIPCLPIFEAEPVRGYWQVYQAESLRQLALITAQALSDLAYNIKMTSYQKPVVSLPRNGQLETSNEQMMDVAYPLIIKGEGSVSVVDFRSDFPGLLDTIFKRAAAPLARWGMRTEMIKQGGLDATSGWHLELQLSALTKKHKQRSNRWRTRERRAYAIAEKVMEVERRREENSTFGLMPLPQGKLQVQHGDLGPPRNRMEEAEYWALLVDKGFAEQVDAIQEIHDLTREEAEEKLQRITAQTAARAAASTFGMGMDQESEAMPADEAQPATPAPASPMAPMGGDV